MSNWMLNSIAKRLEGRPSPKTMNSVPTYAVRLHMAGDIEQAKRVLRKACYPPNEGLCVTVERATYIYTGGEEEGFVVGFVNYPRFPQEPCQLWERAKEIASQLIPELCQWSALLVAPDKTEWINLRRE
jgi:hypothetical protein